VRNFIFYRSFVPMNLNLKLYIYIWSMIKRIRINFFRFCMHFVSLRVSVFLQLRPRVGFYRQTVPHRRRGDRPGGSLIRCTSTTASSTCVSQCLFCSSVHAFMLFCSSERRPCPPGWTHQWAGREEREAEPDPARVRPR
jgi:hypothetical protein